MRAILTCIPLRSAGLYFNRSNYLTVSNHFVKVHEQDPRISKTDATNRSQTKRSFFSESISYLVSKKKLEGAFETVRSFHCKFYRNYYHDPLHFSPILILTLWYQFSLRPTVYIWVNVLKQETTRNKIMVDVHQVGLHVNNMVT